MRPGTCTTAVLQVTTRAVYTRVWYVSLNIIWCHYDSRVQVEVQTLSGRLTAYVIPRFGQRDCTLYNNP